LDASWNGISVFQSASFILYPRGIENSGSGILGHLNAQVVEIAQIAAKVTSN